MKKGRFESAFVTDPDGRFLGLVSRQDLEAESASWHRTGRGRAGGRRMAPRRERQAD
jgi:hypothetical protein